MRFLIIILILVINPACKDDKAEDITASVVNKVGVQNVVSRALLPTINKDPISDEQLKILHLEVTSIEEQGLAGLEIQSNQTPETRFISLKACELDGQICKTYKFFKQIQIFDLPQGNLNLTFSPCVDQNIATQTGCGTPKEQLFRPRNLNSPNRLALYQKTQELYKKLEDESQSMENHFIDYETKKKALGLNLAETDQNLDNLIQNWLVSGRTANSLYMQVSNIAKIEKLFQVKSALV